MSNKEAEIYDKIPKSLIVHQGSIGIYLKKLEKDVRKIMEPETASNLKINKKNKLKDFVSVASSLKVSHIWSISMNKVGNPNLKIVNLPNGPTIYTKIMNYTLAKDVVSNLKKNVNNTSLFKSPALLIMNNLSKTQSTNPHLALIRVFFQNIFSAINVNTLDVSAVRRCVLLNYNDADDLLSIRHYAIKLLPVGVSKGVKTIVRKRVLNLSNQNDISDILLNGGEGLSESEAELDLDSEVIVNTTTKDKSVNHKKSVRLYEIGPRLDLKLYRIESGVCSGTVLYHAFKEIDDKLNSKIVKTVSTKKQTDNIRKERRLLQEKNVKRKRDEILSSDKCTRKVRKLQKQLGIYKNVKE
ncbi:Peter Pan-like protein [Intoshia linei]|uniref:Peter Pan-like protein n=1 Tax=Intoshia linei TaxID=1819745 RepID=A0A177ATK2_9BILA|nr:Peter Pan-like protein [Intoshia linei]